MKNAKAIMIVKESEFANMAKELADVLASEQIFIKVEKDEVFNTMFDIGTTEINIDISDEDLLFLTREAHKKNITLNQMIVEVITEQMEKTQNK